MNGPVLSPGVITIRDNLIESVAPLKPDFTPEEEFIDLRPLVLMPGFVNTHCHLELTSIGPIAFHTSHQQISFAAWVRKLLQKKVTTTETEAIAGIQAGIKALLASGVTTVGDHISADAPWQNIVASPLRGILFGEVLGVDPAVANDHYEKFRHLKKALQNTATLFDLRICPHSVQSVAPEVLTEIFRNEPAPLSCHIAESEDEQNYFENNAGPLADLIRERGGRFHHGTPSALTYLAGRNLPLEKLMAIHANYLSDDDVACLHTHHVPVVHCPGSHAYFGHQSFPLKKLADLPLALGTDSVTSNESLDFLEELRRFRKTNPDLSASEILHMATVGGATALRMQDKIGMITPGKCADIVGFRNLGLPEEAPFEARRADFVMINGRVFSPSA